MRAVVLGVCLLPVAAAAGPFRDVIAHRAPADGAKHFTQVSRTIYLNPCMPNGCTVQPGFDDSLTDHSSIPQNQAHLAAFGYGQDAWSSLVACVKDMYAPFDIQVTDVDPGQTPHFEVMVAGNSTDVGVPGAGGVAPFVPCDGQLQDNVISFVFASSTNNLDFLCWAAAQESAHVFGLDHELEAKDPMTYLSPPVKKPGFQNVAVSCGENQPRTCYCGNDKQNSYQYLMDTFGPAHLDPASLAIDAPTDGQWVKPGFTVKATATSQLSVRSSSLSIDGAMASSLDAPPLVFDTPAELAAGDHTIDVSATDAAARTMSGEVKVHVVGACQAGACNGNFKCLGGYCLPAADTPGGLGATCTDSSECITGTCGTAGTDHLCTGPCDAGGTCPDGFACVMAAGTSGVCWPAPSSGGCAASGDGAPLAPLALVGGLVLVLRRRR